MGLPSEANLRTAIGKWMKIYNEARKFGNVTATNNFEALELDYMDEVPTDSAPGAQNAQASFRAGMAAMLHPSNIQACLAPLLTTYGRVKLYPDVSPRAVLARLYQDFAEAGTAVTVKSRGWSFGSPAAGGSNVGTGSIVRCTTDGYNYAIEGCIIAEAKEVRCIADEHSGATRHEEVFAVRGSSGGHDWVNPTGTGMNRLMTCLSANGSSRYLQNPSFESVEASGATITALTGWVAGTPGVWTNFETVTSDYYKDVPQAATSRSLRFKTNDSVEQTFETQRITWDPNVPLFFQVAYKRESSCDGTLTITCGGKTAAVVLAGSGWTVLRFSVAQDAWFRRWNSSNAIVKIALSGNTTGDLLVDDVIFGQFQNVDGTWLAAVGGATNFLKEDIFTYTDTCTESGIVQRIFARAYPGFYLPHEASPVWADPT